MKQTTKKTALALGAAGATMAAAAGAYYLYGSEKAAQNRRKVGAWMRRAEREIVHEAKRLKNTAYSDANIRRVINAVADRYEAARELDPDDVKLFISAVQRSWKQAGKAVQSRSRKTKKSTRAKKKS